MNANFLFITANLLQIFVFQKQDIRIISVFPPANCKDVVIPKVPTHCTQEKNYKQQCDHF